MTFFLNFLFFLVNVNFLKVLKCQVQYKVIVILISKCHLQYINHNYINFKVNEQEKVLNTYIFVYVYRIIQPIM